MPKKRKKKPETLKQHTLSLVREILECPGPLCEHCQVLITRELEPLLKIAEIEMPKKGSKQ